MEKLTADPQTGRVVWTREAFRMMADAGIFSDGRYELLEGEIVKIMPNEHHAWVTTRLVFRMARLFGEDFVRVPGFLAASPGSEPEPDVAVTKQSGEVYLLTGIPRVPERPLLCRIIKAQLVFRLEALAKFKENHRFIVCKRQRDGVLNGPVLSLGAQLATAGGAGGI